MKIKWYILISLGAVVPALRIAMPHIAQRYVNRTLDDLEKYEGSVQRVSINL